MSTPATPTAAGATGTPLVAACVKWVDLRPDIDVLHGTVQPSERGGGFSPADRAAVEVAIRLAEGWGWPLALVCAGPVEAEGPLAELAASAGGVEAGVRVVRVQHDVDQPAGVTADVLAPVLGPADLGVGLVVCGDLSYDRGSGAVPALLAHHLQAAQALGLIEVDRGAGAPGVVEATRRLDGARRERIRVRAPAVLSVEGAVAVLRRAPLAAALGAGGARGVEHRRGLPEGHAEPPRLKPWRPRARVLPAPAGDTALERIRHLTDAIGEHAPPRTVDATPEQAAALIVEQLREWGYLGGPAGAEGG